ncbi:MAG: ABC transporter permease [Clostridia bacterium]|nr:ABC transporter permease [Clostridia bacterium]
MENKTNKVREPLFHITKRSNNAMKPAAAWGVRIAAVVVALILCGVVTVLLTGENPFKVYETMIDGAFGSERKIWALAQNTAVLLCISLAVTPAFKMKFWNIGAEGQVLMGGLATAACMILLGNKLPPILFYPVMIIASVAAGAIWGLIPAFFKAQWNTNETLFTLMMNYIAIQIVSYFCYIWSVPKGSGHIGIINSASQMGWFPKIGGQSYLCNILIVLVLTVFMFIYFKYSKHGYEISVVGESENTARYIGINVKKVILRTMLLSGAVCGIAGLILVSGTDHTITRDTAGGRGFTAIMVSWLAHFDPIYMIITSLLIAFLEKGAGQISTNFGLNDSFSEILTGIIIFFIIGSEFFINYEIKFREKEAKK